MRTRSSRCSQGTVDVAANWWNDEQESNLLRMARKNMAKAEDFRIIYKSEQIVNSPMAYLTDLPDGAEGQDPRRRAQHRDQGQGRLRQDL